ncbi:MAG: hypothetical protein ACLQM8_11070 [Limisphaerales bacterium]
MRPRLEQDLADVSQRTFGLLGDLRAIHPPAQGPIGVPLSVPARRPSPEGDAAQQGQTRGRSGEGITPSPGPARLRGEASRDLIEDPLRTGLLA